MFLSKKFYVLAAIGALALAGTAYLILRNPRPASAAPEPEFSVTETALGKLDEHTKSVTMSADLRHVAFVDVADSKSSVRIDGGEPEEYDAVSGVIFSPDSARVAYMAKSGKRVM